VGSPAGFEREGVGKREFPVEEGRERSERRKTAGFRVVLSWRADKPLQDLRAPSLYLSICFYGLDLGSETRVISM